MLKGLTLVLVGGLLAALSPRVVPAQDCGMSCLVCGASRWEGVTYDEKGPYNMSCLWDEDGGGCDKTGCNETVMASREDWIAAEAIAEVIYAASVSELPALLEAYGDRLLYVPERQAVVVKGSECSADWLGRMVMLPREKALAFGKLNVTLARDYFAAKKTASVLAQAR